jgi:hypothetical protein
VSTLAFPVTTVGISPALNFDVGGLRPRYDDHVATAVTVAGGSPISRIRASIQGCSLDWAADCTAHDVTLATPANTATVDLPAIIGAEGGRSVTVDLTIEGEDGSSAQQSITRDFWPADSGLGVACERRYNAGRLEITLSLVDEGLPIVPGSDPAVPYSLSDLFDVRWYIYQRGPFGWQPDETSSFWGQFVYDPPTLDVFDDGIYQVIVIGQLGFVDAIQAVSLTFDTTGAGPDLCTLAP